MNWMIFLNIIIIILGIVIFAGIIWLLVPTIFRYLVAPLFDGSYEPRKDKIKTRGSLPTQNNNPDIRVDSLSGKYSINFGISKNFHNGNVRIHHNNQWFAAIPALSESQLNLITTNSTEGEDKLGRYLLQSQKWEIPDSDFRFETRIYQYNDAQFIMFEVFALSHLKILSNGNFDNPVIQFPSFSNNSTNQRIFTYHSGVFCPPSRDFSYETSPVLLFDDDRNSVLISAVDNFLTNGIQKTSSKKTHDIISCGPNGEIEEMPDGFSYKYIMVFEKGINKTFKKWGDILRKYHRITPKDRYTDVALSYLGYFTDNGAFYYYNPIKGAKYDETLVRVDQYARENEIPFGYYQLDSWWYKKSVAAWKRKLLGNFGRIVGGGLYGGTLRWEVDPEAMDLTPLELSQKLGNKPFVAHNRWYDLTSSYPEEFHFIKGKKWAMPDDYNFWDRIMHYCKENRIEVYEQDWMKNQLKEFPHLRSQFGAAEKWLSDMARAAEKYGITIQYCMTTPAMAMTSMFFPAVSHMRASGDYNPRWPKVYDTPFLMQTSMLAWAVGFWPFKDVFESTRKGKINGERSPVLMGLVSATSGGPVAPGDEIGFVNKETVAAVARIDGLLLKPDRPMTATDLTYVRNSTYYVSSTESSHNAFTWYYTLTVNFWPHRIKNKGYFLKDIDILGDFVEYNWFNKEIREVSSDSLISQSLRFEAFIYRVYAPIFPNGIAVVGDPSKYISMADRAFSKCRYSEEDNSIEIVAENALGAKSNLLIYCKTLPTEVIIDGDNIFDVSGKFGDSYTYNPSSKTLVIPLHFAEQSQINLKINP